MNTIKDHPAAISRRTLIAGGVVAASTAAFPALASGAYPDQTIKIVMPFPGGSMFDATIRALAVHVAKALGQPVVLEAKPGAGGVYGPSTVARMKAADGYTLTVMHNSVIRQPHMMKVDWDPIKDFSYVTGLFNLTTGIAVAADAPWKTLAELLADAKARPGEISWGNVGAISANRIYAQRLAKAAGVKFNYIPFKGGAEEITAVLGGHLDVYGDPGFGTTAKAGRLRLLATFTEQRLPNWPNVPTVKELGFDLVVQSPVGLLAPKNLDPAILMRLQNAFQAAANSPEYLRILQEYDLQPWLVSGAEFRKYAEAQYLREKQMLDEVGFKPE